MRLRSLLALTFVLAPIACSSTSEDHESSSPVRGGDPTAPSSEPAPGTTGSNPPASPPGIPEKKLGTLVVLGDSIGDGGGVGPFYYARLREMLETKYGAITFERRAKGGSKTDALSAQIGALPQTLPGPIAVAITSGGNDMKAQLQAIVLGTDSAARAKMGDNIGRALDKLLEPNRFGPGVVVRVFEGNIYDASDGKGDYGAHDCAFGKGMPPLATDGYFDAWNTVIAQEASKRSQLLVDMHTIFHGHGYASPPSWYHTDCTHPSTTGHEELAKRFFDAITTTAF